MDRLCDPPWVANQRPPFSSFSFSSGQCPQPLSAKRHGRKLRLVECNGSHETQTQKYIKNSAGGIVPLSAPKKSMGELLIPLIPGFYCYLP